MHGLTDLVIDGLKISNITELEKKTTVRHVHNDYQGLLICLFTLTLFYSINDYKKKRETNNYCGLDKII